MKLSGSIKSSYWQIGFIVGGLIFLALTTYLGYKLWSNSRADLESIQQIREFQLSSSNALFFAKKAMSGDATSIDPFVKTFESLENNISFLQSQDAAITDTFDDAFSLWQEARDGERGLVEIEYAIKLINAVHERLVSGAANAEKIAIDNLEQMDLTRVAKSELTGLTRQSSLLAQMANNIGDFISDDKAGKEVFDKFRSNFTAFEQNHIDLLNGNAGRNIRPISNPQIRLALEQFRTYLDGVRTADTYIFRAADRLLTARQSQAAATRNIESLQFSFSDAASELKQKSGNRFPSLTLVVISGLLMLLCAIGFILFQQTSSKVEISRQREEGQRTQGAILRLLDELVDLADGDLTISATVSEDFTGAIADSINFTIDQLRQLVSRINSTAVQVSQAAQGTQQTALHLAEASDHQAQEIAGASAAINEMAVTIDQVSANASESALVAGKSVSIANNGAKLVQNTIHGMDTIREQIQDTSKRIKRLGESSQEIGDIVSLINDIADQTNILALNAAIQASMAGDAGRGFAVVADEVQRLAERSAAATKQIESLVKTIQTDTNEAVISMEQTTSEVVRGARLAQDAGVALEEIEGVSANLAELIQNISNAARQQASSAGHISNTMNVIQEITSQTSAGTSETAQSIGDLAGMAFELRESVAGFTLPGEMEAVEEDSILPAPDSEQPNTNEPPILEDSVEYSVNKQESDIDSLLEEMDIDDGDVQDDDDFFDMLADEDEEDLLSEFDIDLTDDSYPKTSEGETTRKS